MASVDVLTIKKVAFGKVKVSIEARTSLGRFTFPVDIVDQGSAGANEAQALRELLGLVEETTDAIRLRLGSQP